MTLLAASLSETGQDVVIDQFGLIGIHGGASPGTDDSFNIGDQPASTVQRFPGRIDDLPFSEEL